MRVEMDKPAEVPTFGGIIEKVLAEKKRSVRWLSEKTGIPYSTLRGRLGSPEGRLSFLELHSILRALEIDLVDLIASRSPEQLEFDFHRRLRKDSHIVLLEKIRACIDELEGRMRTGP